MLLFKNNTEALWSLPKGTSWWLNWALLNTCNVSNMQKESQNLWVCLHFLDLRKMSRGLEIKDEKTNFFFLSSSCCTKHLRKGWVELQHCSLTSRSLYAVFPDWWLKPCSTPWEKSWCFLAMWEDCFQCLMLVHKCLFYSVFRMTPAPQTRWRWYTLVLFYFGAILKTAFK